MPDTRASSRVQHGGLPFREAIEHHRQKVNVPTETYQDLTRGAHARAFTVAGAEKEELLADFRQAVDKALAEGRTIRDFRKDFDATVKRHGWEHTGTPGFRARTIYQTNLRTAYQAGRYQQQQAIKKRRPYWRYRHGGSANPRDEHLAWDGLILRADDPWWHTHYPPNGWGCSCRVETLSERDMKRLGLVVSKAPTSPESMVGIDEGWDYSVGEAATGQRLSDEAFESFKKSRETWQPLTQEGDLGAIDPPAPPQPVPVPLPPVANATERLTELLGGPEQTFVTPGGGIVNVNAASLGRYVGSKGAGRRARFLPLVPEVLQNPAEVWRSFERHAGNGKVVMRTRYLRSYVDADDRKTFAVIVVDASAGRMNAYNIIPMTDLKQFLTWRQGKLVYRSAE